MSLGDDSEITLRFRFSDKEEDGYVYTERGIGDFTFPRSARVSDVIDEIKERVGVRSGPFSQIMFMQMNKDTYERPNKEKTPTGELPEEFLEEASDYASGTLAGCKKEVHFVRYRTLDEYDLKDGDEIYINFGTKMPDSEYTQGIHMKPPRQPTQFDAMWSDLPNFDEEDDQVFDAPFEAEDNEVPVEEEQEWMPWNDSVYDEPEAKPIRRPMTKRVSFVNDGPKPNRPICSSSTLMDD